MRLATRWRDVGPCRVRLASLTDAAIFQLFLTDEERCGNLPLWKNLLLRACREKMWNGEIEEQRGRVGGVGWVGNRFPCDEMPTGQPAFEVAGLGLFYGIQHSAVGQAW